MSPTITVEKKIVGVTITEHFVTDLIGGLNVLQKSQADAPIFNLQIKVTSAKENENGSSPSVRMLALQAALQRSLHGPLSLGENSPQLAPILNLIHRPYARTESPLERPVQPILGSDLESEFEVRLTRQRTLPAL